MGSSSLEVTRTGRKLTRKPSSATRAARLADRTAANVATASTRVPTAVAKVAIVVQLIAAMPALYGPRLRRQSIQASVDNLYPADSHERAHVEVAAPPRAGEQDALDTVAR